MRTQVLLVQFLLIESSAVNLNKGHPPAKQVFGTCVHLKNVFLVFHSPISVGLQWKHPDYRADSRSGC